MSEETQNPFGAEFVEATAGKFIKWEEVGQNVKGTCVDIYERENSLKNDEMQTIVVLEQEDGTDVQVSLKDASMKGACKKLVVGQQVAFLFADLIKSKVKGHQDFKHVKVYLGQLDPKFKTNEVDESEIKVEDIGF